MRLLLLLILALSLRAADPLPLPRAHAHNDYEHTRPLLDALAQGFGSVEADVYPVDGDLLVAHDFKNVKKERTLDALYLAPLKKKFDENGGKILPELRTLILLVDIKTNALGSYQILEKQIEKYRPMLTEFAGEEIKTNAVTIILSGDRPRDYLASQKQRWVAMDGRMSDLALNPSRALIPLVSDSWGTQFKWRAGQFPEAESQKLKGLVNEAHRQGRIIRFWGAPDGKETWGIHHDAGVDLINTDRLEELATFLKGRPSRPGGG
jgi:hypothetical protein